MLSLTRSRLSSLRILLPCGGFSGTGNMTDRGARLHFKRLLEERREERLEKLKKVKMDDKVDSRDLKIIILGNGTTGCSTSVVVSSPTRSYLFNCGEGTQKLCTEYRVKLPRISNVFLTSLKWKNLGGILGYLLTAQSLGLPVIAFHGPKPFTKILESAQRFIKVDDINIHHHEKEFFEDQVLRVQRVKLEKSPPTPEDEDPRKDIFAYVCRGYEKPGRLLLEKCVEKGVPAGPLFSKLKSGSEITLENGDVVSPADVLDPPHPASVFVVLECPSEDYVDSLLASEAIAAHQNLPGSDPDHHANCVVHMTPDAVYNSEKYKKFLGLFAEKTYHVQLSDSNSTEVSAASVERIVRLNQIHDELFPLLPGSESSKFPPMTTINLREGTIERDARLEVSVEKVVEEVQEFDNFTEVRDQLRKKLASMPRLDDREYPKITFLGTGSAMPTKDRNVAGIIVRPCEGSAFLLDCGESTSNQMIRAFGCDKTSELLAQLKFIFISHIHADHHLGLVGIILKRKAMGITDRLTVIGPSFVAPWIRQISSNFEEIDCITLNSRELLGNGTDSFSESAVKRIRTCYVDHCPESYGIRVDMENYSLVYSGDTLPCDNLVQLGKDCDLLIHEATMEDELLADAKYKAHSTTSQAVEIGKKMNSKFTLLTHFSQRYAKLPFIEESIFSSGRVGMAFDFMHVCPKSLHVLPHIYPMLKCVYSEHYEGLQEKTQKYADRKQQVFVKI